MPFTAKWTKEFLQGLIADKVEENLELEYKGRAALDGSDKCKDEITKDVSAFANSAGGVLIYGIAEERTNGARHPIALEPISSAVFSKERLDQVISTVRPRIAGVAITSVSVSGSPGEAVYVVEIPQSTTAHQARDRRYYKRRNFIAEPMDDYEIRDILLRERHPELSLSFSLVPMQSNTGLYLTLENVGRMVAQFACAYVRLPASLQVDTESSELFQFNLKNGDTYFEAYLRNVHRDLIGREGQPGSRDYKNEADTHYYASRYDPILPMMHKRYAVTLQRPIGELRTIEDSIEYTIHVDSAPPKGGRQIVKEIRSH